MAFEVRLSRLSKRIKVDWKHRMRYLRASIVPIVILDVTESSLDISSMIMVSSTTLLAFAASSEKMMFLHSLN